MSDKKLTKVLNDLSEAITLEEGLEIAKEGELLDGKKVLEELRQKYGE